MAPWWKQHDVIEQKQIYDNAIKEFYESEQNLSDVILFRIRLGRAGYSPSQIEQELREHRRNDMG
jgi:hypothetical protein